MDLFERAHVLKIKETKLNKEQVATKKQLKLMLHGYKTSDNELIKEAEKLKVDLNESSSVSGFSDLNLTSSSDEEIYKPISNSELDQSMSTSNMNAKTESSHDNIISSENTTAGESLSDTVTSASFASIDETIPTCSNSLTECDEDDSSSTNFTPSSPLLTEESIISSIDSLSESNLSEFDANGELALQIHERLKSHKQQEVKNQIKHEKRKINDVDILSVENKKSKHEKKLKSKKIYDNEKNENPKFLLKKDAKVSDSLNLQAAEVHSPFVSITAIDLQEESFDHILGDYKHSTIRNLPLDNQSPLFLTDSTFPVENFSADINIRNIDEVSSLIPEVDNDLSVLDLDETDTNSLTMLETDLKETPTESIETCMPLDESINNEQINDKYKVYFGKKNCIIVLRHPAELYIHGKVIVKALGGSVEVFGHKLTDVECPIIAPFYTYAQCFKTVQNNNEYKYLFSKLQETGITFQEIEEIVVNIGKYDGVIFLKPMECPKMNFVAQNFRNTNLFKINHYKGKLLDNASTVLGCTLYSTRPQKFFQENPLWETVLPNNQSSTITIACGGKGSGKSTFMRYYVNRLLQRGPVLVIDLDPGQSEFTVAGNVSATIVDKPIFGPSFTHLKKPNMCLNIGIISTMDNIQRYVNAVKSVISYSRDNFSMIPWVINTMGMTNAVGLKFMALIITLAQPDFVLQYGSRNAKKCFDTRLTAANVKDLLRKYKYDKIFSNLKNDVSEYSLIMAPEVEILGPNKSSLIPRDERYLSFLAYFGDLAVDLDHENLWLFGITPYEVSLKDLTVAVNVRLKNDCITKVINGKVVALCQQTTQCHNARVFTLDDKPLLCHGHGLIRGIDWQHEVIYVLTPLSSDELRLVNTLVYADWVPELRGQEVYLSEGTKVPYRTTAQHEQSKLMAVPKRRFNPLQLLKMTRDS
ncbi:polynucleotide 5'-hydroxyl-kinase nol9 [Pieris rapae]|uniref:polynucleotide 5'-hydroxyl-kinase nol9 n=1 Tax=Pieris rapae TaxID=64459 RepID=UPI001E28164C|nr:polynucleotide 5'-hydroxyl-kinase nol9 [Pieris rapae]